MAEVAPYAAAGDDPAPLRIKTAIFMTLRNEDPARAILRLEPSKPAWMRPARAAPSATSCSSDTNDPAVAAAEEHAVAAWQAADPDRERIIYRRRTDNTGYKAGNVRDFCARWGRDYELMLPLDADSLMSATAIVRLVRMMQAHPKIGILQSLVVGMPSSQRVRAHLPVRHAPRHALLHHGTGLVGRRLRTVLGPQRRWCASSRSTSSASCRCCRASRRSAAMCSRTTRSRRP